MSSDETAGGKPEFPMRDEQTDGAASSSHNPPPLPDIPAWQAPAGDPVSEPVVVEPVSEAAVVEPLPEPDSERDLTPAPERDLTPEPARAVVEETVIVEPLVESPADGATRAPIGGPYVVTETGAPVAEQAVIAYERPALGGPYVTASEPSAPDVVEPTPYPAAAFATGAAVGAAATASAPPVGGVPYGDYQPLPQPVSAPLAPAPKGNRGGGTLIALLGTVAFAVVYAAVAFIIIAANVSGAAAAGTALGAFLLTAAFIVPVVVFAISLILIVLIVNRAGWWAYVLGGFIVAVLVYIAGIAGALIHVQAWNWQPQEQYDFVRSLTMDPLTLAGAIVAREASIWTGAWIAARGRKVKARNLAAREEFDRVQTAESKPASW